MYVHLCKKYSLDLHTYRICINENVQYFSSPFEFSRPGLGHVLLYLAIEGTLYLLLTLIIEVITCLLSILS